ncbi:virulence RhuM family protein [Maribacter algicola]|uniref:Virulence RhuM family protein n=1 Tax=Meishania litoralis TaxID=3434685 RepID=A0ACC7LGQ6_9FLAO
MSEIVIYKSDTNQIEVSVQLEKDTVWLNLNQIATLFDRDKSIISRHLNNIFKTKELQRNSVVAKNATTASDGKTYQVDFFNLDAILSVGYRVNSKQGTAFRIWANSVLKQYLVDGYAINEKRLAQKEQEIRMPQRGKILIAENYNVSNLSSGGAKY